MTHSCQDTPLRGRDRELRRLATHFGFDETATGAAAIVGGAAGIGKSRLLREVIAQAARHGIASVVGHCVGPAGSSLPYLPLSEIVGQVATFRPSAASAIAQSHPALNRLLPSGLEGRDIAAEPAALAEAVHALLIAAAAEGPLLTVVEDAHWADHSSRDLITVLLTRGFPTPLLFVVSYRTDDLHRRHPLTESLAVWTRLPGVQHLTLGRLAEQHIREIAREAGARDNDLDAVVARAEGNPFFAEELASIDGAALGENLTRILLTRIDALSEPARMLVHIAALHGRDISHDLLEAVSPLPPGQFDAAIREAVDQGIFTVDETGAYVFRHALLAEAAVDDLLPGERRRLHRGYVAALTSGVTGATAAATVMHAVAAGDDEVAVRAAIAAGDEATAIGGPHEALDYYTVALERLDEDDDRRDEVLLRAARAADSTGDVPRAVNLLHDRLQRPPAGETELARARIMAALAREARIIDVLPEPWRYALQAFDLVPGEATLGRLEVLISYIDALGDLERDEEALQVAEEALALAAQLDRPDLAIEVRGAVFRSLRRARNADNDWLASARFGSAGDPAVRIRLQLIAGLAERDAGHLEEALTLFLEGTRLASQARIPWSPWGALCRVNAALTALDLGRLDEALSLTRISGRRGPEPRATHLRAVRLHVREARDGDVTAEEIDQTRGAWHLDGYTAHIATLAGLALDRRLRRPAAAIARVRDVLPILERSWGDPGHALLRYTAIAAAAIADAAGETDPAWRDTLALWAQRARECATSQRTGREGRAWLARMDAELTRLDDSPQQQVAAFKRAVSAFLGQPLDQAWARLGLSGALARAGHSAAARNQRAAVAQTAEQLGSATLANFMREHDAQATHEAALTPREREVLVLLAAGRTNGQIAEKLVISRKTASVHVSNLLAKLRASTRGEAVALARAQGLVD